VIEIIGLAREEIEIEIKKEIETIGR